ncbi:MAG: hypothetical protein WCZ43_13480 [Proteiniphilum sp.]
MKRRKPSEAEVDKAAGNSKKHPEAARSTRRNRRDYNPYSTSGGK